MGACEIMPPIAGREQEEGGKDRGVGEGGEGRKRNYSRKEGG